MSEAGWGAVDDYIGAHLLGQDQALDAVLAANAAGGLAAIDVSAAQGKMLHLLARMAGAADPRSRHTWRLLDDLAGAGAARGGATGDARA